MLRLLLDVRHKSDRRSDTQHENPLGQRVERSGMTGMADNQKVPYELREGRDGRDSADNIQLA